MFESFTIGGLTMQAFVSQITGFLSAQVVVGAMLAAMGLGIAVSVARSFQHVVNHGHYGKIKDDEYYGYKNQRRS